MQPPADTEGLLYFEDHLVNGLDLENENGHPFGNVKDH